LVLSAQGAATKGIHDGGHLGTAVMAAARLGLEVAAELDYCSKGGRGALSKAFMGHGDPRVRTGSDRMMVAASA